MSRRPRGPSDRPLYYDPESLDGSEAPRLPSQSLISRVVMGALLLFCCGVIAMSGLFVVSFFAQLPRPATATAMGPGAAVVSIEHHGMRRPRRQRSVLQRLAMLRRAPAPAKGVDEASVRAIFPHWHAADGSMQVPSVLSDMVLALSYLAQEEVDDDGG